MSPQFLALIEAKKIRTITTETAQKLSQCLEHTDFMFWNKPSSTITNFWIFFKGLFFNFCLLTELPLSCCTETRIEKKLKHFLQSIGIIFTLFL